jgi:hypothetical protein
MRLIHISGIWVHCQLIFHLERPVLLKWSRELAGGLGRILDLGTCSAAPPRESSILLCRAGVASLFHMALAVASQDNNLGM